jgi:hypothetical protein
MQVGHDKQTSANCKASHLFGRDKQCSALVLTSSKYFQSAAAPGQTEMLFPNLHKALYVSRHYMKFHLRHFVFLVGLIAIFFSYLLYASMPFVSFMILVGAFFTSLFAFVAIMAKDSLKLKLIFFALAIVIFFLRDPLKKCTIDRSYNLILVQNEKIFNKVNAILISKQEDVCYPPIPGHEDSIFSVFEVQILNQFLRETPVKYIRKDKLKIFYPTRGVPLEMDYGIYYFYSGFIPSDYFKHIKGKWYFD